jgi:hypothetical protein
MAESPSENDHPLDAMTGDELRDHALSRGFVLDGLKQNAESALRDVLTALVGTPAGPGGAPPAAPGLKDKWNTAKAAKTAGTGGFSTAKKNGRTTARTCVNVLKPRLGDQWNNSWQTAGFTDGSLAIPENPLTILRQISAYFAANPSHEVGNLKATATQCTSDAEAISTAATASNQSNTDAGTAKSDLEVGISNARSRLSGLRNELGQLLEDDDERWYAFGFSKPSDPETPEVPENLVITPGPAGSHMVFIDWDNALRAASYRVLIKRNVVNSPELKNIIVTESEVTVSDIASATPITVTVSARNSKGGESNPTEPVNAAVP